MQSVLGGDARVAVDQPHACLHTTPAGKTVTGCEERIADPSCETLFACDELPCWDSIPNLDWKRYSSRARILARVFNPRWFSPYDFAKLQIDHKFSIWAGYHSGVPLDVIANRNNLALIGKAENLRKSIRCSITIKDLYNTSLPDKDVSRLAEFLCTVDDLERLNHWVKLAGQWDRQPGSNPSSPSTMVGCESAASTTAKTPIWQGGS
jgi:hypothetical protein